MKRLKFLTLTLLSFVFGAAAQDAPIKYKDWVMEKKTLAAPFGESCVAYTDKKVGDDTWRLSFVVSAEGKPNAAFFVSAAIEHELNAFVARSSGSRELFAFNRLGDVDEVVGGSVFWQIPERISVFYSRLKWDSSVRINYVDEAGEDKHMYFSLRGSSRTFDNTLRACELRRAFDAEFYDALGSAETIDVGEGDVTAASLWATQLEAQDLYLAIAETQEALGELQSEIDPLVADKEDHLRRSGELSEEIEESIETKALREEQLQATIAEIARDEAALAQEEQRLEPAMAKLQEKEDAFAPVRERSKAFFDAVSRAEGNVASAQREISRIDGQISDKESDLWNLSREKNTLRGQVTQLNRELNSLRTDLARAEGERDSFNYQHYLEELKDDDSRYQQLLRGIRDCNRIIEDRERALEVARRENQQARFLLRQCQRTPDANCSQEANEVSRTARAVDDLERRLRGDRQTLDSFERRLDDREDDLRDTADSRQRQLNNRVTSLKSTVASKQGDMDLKQRRIDQIILEEGQTRSLISSLRSQRGGAVERKDRAERALDQAEIQLSEFKAANNYDALERAYESALEVVRGIQQNTSRLQREIASGQSSKTRLEGEVQRLGNLIETLMAESSSNSEELRTIQEELEPLLAEKEELNFTLSQQQEDFASSASKHRSISRALLDPESNSAEIQVTDSILQHNQFWDWM